MAKIDAKAIAQEIVQYVGGPENVNSVAHCMTRARFVLKNVNKADQEALKNIKGVLGVIYSGGQLQVILGANLLPVFEEIVKQNIRICTSKCYTFGSRFSCGWYFKSNFNVVALRNAKFCRLINKYGFRLDCQCTILLYAYIRSLWCCKKN